MKWRSNSELRRLGAVMYDLWLPETNALPTVLSSQEQILGIVYGRFRFNSEPYSRGALAVTDRRVILVNKKPFFLRCDEIAYRVISGVTYSKVGPIGTVTLHTRQGDIKLRTFNKKCASGFVRAIETSIFNNRATNNTAI